MTTTLKCNHAGCNWETTKSSKGSAEQSLRMHVSRKHGNNGGNPRLANKGAPVAEKRTYKKKMPVVQEVRVNFCPDCGCDIHRVAVGMALAGRMKKT